MTHEPDTYGLDLGEDDLQLLRALAAGRAGRMPEATRSRLERLGYLEAPGGVVAGDAARDTPRLTPKGRMTALLAGR